jgi:hypothetical protein
LIDGLEYKRGRHAITEIQRTLDASKALKENELNRVGMLMNQSHDSLRYNSMMFFTIRSDKFSKLLITKKLSIINKETILMFHVRN